jgi:hypothetical protein
LWIEEGLQLVQFAAESHIYHKIVLPEDKPSNISYSACPMGQADFLPEKMEGLAIVG